MAYILVVDDEEPMRNIVVAALVQCGHVVAQAADGREAVLKIQTMSPDLIITDILMPESDGLEILMNLARENRKIPVIAMTGIPGEAALYLGIARRLGAVRTLAKPFTIEELTRAINEVLDLQMPRSLPGLG